MQGDLSSVGPAVLYLLPCGGSGCTTADQGGSVTRPHPRQLGVCLHLAHTVETLMTTQAAPLKKDSSSRTPQNLQSHLAGRVHTRRTEFLTEVSTSGRSMKKSGLCTHLGKKQKRKELTMPSMARPGPMDAPCHQQALTGCTAEIHIPGPSSLVSH